MIVSDEDYDYLRRQPSHRIREKVIIFRRRDLNLQNSFLSPRTTTVFSDPQSQFSPQSEQSDVPPPIYPHEVYELIVSLIATFFLTKSWGERFETTRDQVSPNRNSVTDTTFG